MVGRKRKKVEILYNCTQNCHVSFTGHSAEIELILALDITEIFLFFYSVFIVFV